MTRPSLAAARGTAAHHGGRRGPSRRGSRVARSRRPDYDVPRATMGAVSDDQTLVRITAEPLSVDEALAFIAEPSSGGSCIFVGTVRDSDADGVAVTGLTYESWNDVAADRLREVANRLRER